MNALFPGRCACGRFFAAGAAIDYDREARSVRGCPACRAPSPETVEALRVATVVAARATCAAEETHRAAPTEGTGQAWVAAIASQGAAEQAYWAARNYGKKAPGRPHPQGGIASKARSWSLR